jgi:hypothetical protein
MQAYTTFHVLENYSALTEWWIIPETPIIARRPFLISAAWKPPSRASQSVAASGLRKEHMPIHWTENFEMKQPSQLAGGKKSFR